MAQDKYSQNRQLAYDLLKQEGYTDIGDSAEELFKNRANAELAYKLLSDAGYSDLGADYNEFAGMLYAPEQSTPSAQPSRPTSQVGQGETSGVQRGAERPDQQAIAEGFAMFNAYRASKKPASSSLKNDVPQETRDKLEEQNARTAQKESQRAAEAEKYAAGRTDEVSGYSEQDAINSGKELEAILSAIQEGGASGEELEKRREALLASPVGQEFKSLSDKLNALSNAEDTPENRLEFLQTQAALLRNPLARVSMGDEAPSASQIEFDINRGRAEYINAKLEEGVDRATKKQLKAELKELNQKVLDNEYYQADVAKRIADTEQDLDETLRRITDVRQKAMKEKSPLESIDDALLAYPEYQRLVLSANQLRQQKRKLEHIRDKNAGDFWVNFMDVFSDPNTYNFGISNLETALATVGAYKDQESAGAKDLLNAVVGSNAAQAEEGQYVTNKGRWGAIAANSIPFMVSIGLTKGFDFVGKGVEKAVADRLGKELANKFIVKATGAVLGDLASGFVSAHTIGGAKTMTDFLNNYYGTLTKDEDGNYQYEGGSGNVVKSGWKAGVSNTIEYASERAGEHLQHLLGRGLLSAGIRSAQRNGRGYINPAIETLAKTMDVSLAKDFGIRSANNVGANWATKAMSKFVDLSNRVGVQGYPFEVMEEYIGLLGNILLGGDEKWMDFSSLGDKETHADIWGGMLYSIGLTQTFAFGTGAMGAAAAGIQKAKTYRSLENALGEASESASQVIDEQTWDYLKDKIDTSTNPELVDFITKTMDAAGLDDAQKAAVLDYAKITFIYRGFNAGTIEQARERLTSDDNLQSLNINAEIATASDQVADAYMLGYSSGEKSDENEDRAVLEAAVSRQKEKLSDLTGIQDMTEEQANALLESESASPEVKDAALDYLMAIGVENGFADAERDKQTRIKAQFIKSYQDSIGGPFYYEDEMTGERFVESGVIVGPDGNPETIYIVSDIPDGKGYLPYRSENGEVGLVSPDKIIDLQKKSLNEFSDEWYQSYEQSMEAQKAAEDNAEALAAREQTIPAMVGQTVYVTGNGAYEPVKIERSTNNGQNVVISGDKEALKGIALAAGIASPGGTMLEIPVTSLGPMLATNDDGSITSDQPEAPVSEPEYATPVPDPASHIGEEVEVVLDGNRRNVMIEDVSGGKVYYQIEDESGEPVTRYLPEAEFYQAQMAAASGEQAPVAEDAPVVEAPAEGTPAEEEPQSEIPVDKDGNKIYDAPGVKPIDAYEDMYSTEGLTEADVDEWVISQSDEAEKNRNPKIKKGQSLADWGKAKAEANRVADFWKELREVAEDHIREREEEAKREAERQKEIEKYGVDTRGFDLTPQTVEEAVAEYLGNNEGIIDLDDAKKETFGKSGQIPAELFRHIGNGGILTKKGGRKIADVANDIVGEFEGQLPIEQDAVRDLIIDFLTRYTKTEMREMIFNNRLDAALSELEQQNGASEEVEEEYGPVIKTYDTKKGKVEVRTKVTEKDGVRITKVVSLRNGEEIGTRDTMPMPEGYRITDATNAEGGLDVVGVRELRESEDGRVGATVLARLEDGTLAELDVALERADSIPAEEAVEVQYNRKGRTLTAKYTIRRDADGFTHINSNGSSANIRPEEIGLTAEQMAGPKEEYNDEAQWKDVVDTINEVGIRVSEAVIRPDGTVEVTDTSNGLPPFSDAISKKIVAKFFPNLFTQEQLSEIEATDIPIPASEAVEEAPEGTEVPKVEEPAAEPVGKSGAETAPESEGDTSESQEESVTSQEERETNGDTGFQKPVFTTRNGTDQAQARKNFVEAVGRRLIFALQNGTEKPYKSITDLRKEARAWGLEVEDSGATDILLQELVELALTKAARALTEKNGIKSKNAFDEICRLYELQPTIGRRSADRVNMQQYSTPLPMSFAAQMFAYNGSMSDVLEPTAGNGMLVFGVPVENVHANELDQTRHDNLVEQGFKKVTQQDATEPFTKGDRTLYDAVIANPPFGSHEAVEFDGKMISGLDPIITLRALDSMHDDGKAAIIIGGNVEFADNGAWKTKKAFFSYLYDHYNVKGVVNMAGDLYAKQGTTYPTMMILIDGRRSEEERAASKVYPPTRDMAQPTATTFDELYDIVKNILNDNRKTDGNETVRTEGERESSDSKNEQPTLFDRGRGAESNTNGDNAEVTGQRRGNDSTPGVQRTGENAGSGARSEDAGVQGRPTGERQAAVRNVPGKEPVGNERDASDSSRGSVQETVSGRESNSGNGERVSDGTAGRKSDESLPGGKPSLRKPVRVEKKREAGDKNLSYVQHSGGTSLESVAPAAMAEAMDAALQKIEKEVGKSIDEFVMDELGYKTGQELYDALAAEQIDSVAMAIYQMKKGAAMIIGDQTGVGKGRQMAALIRWANRQGKKPIFFTQKAGLFSDMYRDLVDVGGSNLRPLIINSVSSDKDNSGVMEDKNGRVVYQSPSKEELKKILESGKVPDGYDYVVLSYSQLSSGDEESRKDSRKKLTINKQNANAVAKARFIRSIAKDNYVLLDESHTAAGADSNSGAFLQSIMPSVKGSTFASATFAKRPDTMPLYAIKSAISQANVEPKELIQMIERGGVTLQEIMARALTGAGQMVRRERDMSDVKTDWETINDQATSKRARENYDKAIKIFNDIIAFQNTYITPVIDRISEDIASRMEVAETTRGTENFGADNPPFVNQTYNFTKQLMLALKVDAIVDRVVAEIKAGRHPVIALENTFGSLLDGYKAGDRVEDTSFSAGLIRSLEHLLQYTVREEDGQHQEQLSPEDLGEAGAQAYYALQDRIREATADIFMSPLDAITMKLNEQGYKVGEITGRDIVVAKDDSGYVIKNRVKDKKKAVREFNDGTLDVLIINKTGSTGISLHASKLFRDQRQRSMIIAQPLGDINDYMQMIGRIDRTGQVHRGYYINLSLPVPAELRFNMMLATKLKSLNANTTTSQESDAGSVEAPDFLNKYGSQVVVEYLRDHPDVFATLVATGMKFGGKQNAITTSEELEGYQASEDDAQKVTGRVALFPVTEQEAFYNDIAERYNALIKYLDETGENTLKITTLPLKAKTLARRIATEGRDPNGSNPFAQNSYVERVEVDVLKKPMKADEIRKVRESLLGGKTQQEREAELLDRVETQRQSRLAAENERYEKKKEKLQRDIDKQVSAINAKNIPEADKKAEITRVTNRLTSAADVEAEHGRNISAINNQHDRLRDRFQQFNYDETYLIHETISGGNLFEGAGVPSLFLGFKVAKDGDNLTPSTSFAVFATHDGRRRIEIKFTDGGVLDEISDYTNLNYWLANKTNLANWDATISNATREERYMLTGNILQAWSDASAGGLLPGRLISYTDIDGNIKDGILMNSTWETGSLRSSGKPIDQAKDQIEGLVWGDSIESTDGQVEIQKSRNFLLRVPKSKKDGAKYFQDERLVSLVRMGDFYQRRGKFEAEVSSENLPAVLQRLSELGVRVADESAENSWEEMGQPQNGNTDSDIRFREETDADVLERLDSEPKVTAYRAMQFVPDPNGDWKFDLGDGKGMQKGFLYPPMSAKVNGEWRPPVRKGKWERSVEQPELADEKGRFKLDKGNKKSVPAAYNPYFHSSDTMLNDQFSEAKTRNNLVVVEVELPQREVAENNMNPYHAEKAKDSVGKHAWKAGPIQQQLTGTRNVYLSRWDKPMRIVPVSEVADNVASMVKDQVVEMPSNVVWPQLRSELEKRGVQFVETDNQGKFVDGDRKGQYYATWYKNTDKQAAKERAKERKEEEVRRANILAAEREATNATLDRMSDEMGIKINRVSRSEMPKGHETDKGYYDPKTNEVSICVDNVTDERDAIATVAHETVGHLGLRQLFGDRFNEAMVRIYAGLDEKGRAWVNSYMQRHNLQPGDAEIIRAVEEYMSHLAESGDYKSSVWQRIKEIFGQIMDKLFGTDGFVFTDRELNYILRASYEHLKNPNWLNTVPGKAKDTLMKRELGINESDPNRPTDPEGPGTGILFRDGDTGVANDDYNREMERNWNKALTENQDADLPVRIGMDKIMKEKGIKSISEDEDYVTLHNLASSRAESEAHEFELFRFTTLMDQVRSIQDKLLGKKSTKEDRQQAYERILDYMYAVSGLERNASKNAEIEQAKQDALADAAAAGVTDPAKLADIEKRYEDMKRDWSGLTSLMGVDRADWQAAETAAQGMISAFESEVGDKALLDELWDRVRACTDYNLEHAYHHGLLTREEFETLHGTATKPRMWDYYLPLRGFSEDTAEDNYSYETFTNPSRNSVVVKKMNGRWTEADNPLANILNIAETEIVQGNDNWAKQALYRFTLNAGENSLLSASEPWFVKNPATGKWSMAFPEPDETLEEFEARMKALRELDEPIAKKGRKGLKLENIMANKAHRNEHAIHLKVGGIDKMIWVNGDPALAKAVSGIGRAQNMRWIRRASRVLSNLFTTYSLDFTVKNLIRDTVYSNIALHVKEDKAYRTQYYKNWLSNFGYGAFAYPMIRLASEWDSGKLIEKEKAGTLTKREQDFLNFMRDGGQTGYTIINSVNQIKKNLEKQMRSAGGKPGTIPIIGHYANCVKTLNEAFELLTRFTTYQTSRDMGRSGQKAASDAKEISVNFNRRGAQSGNGIWGNISAYLGATHYFYNAGIQGFDNFLGLFKKKPVKMSAITASFVLMGVLTPLINSMLAGLMGGGDGDDDWYWNVPEWVRRNNIILGTGKWYLAIPLPVELRAPYGIGDIAGSAFCYKKYPNHSFGAVSGDIITTASGILPVNPIEGYTSNGNIGDAVIRAVAPDAGMFFVDWATNRDYTGRPLWKENPFSETVPKSHGAYASTPKGIVAVCQKLAEVSGGNIDIAPGLVRDFANNYGGGFFRAAEDVSKLLFTDELRPRRWDNIPFLSGFTGHIDEDRSNSFAQNALYEYKKISEDVVKRLNASAHTDEITASMAYDHPEDMPKSARVQKILLGKDYELGKMYRDGMNNTYKMKQYMSGANAGQWHKSREVEKKGVNTLRKEWEDLREQWASMPSKTEEEKSAKAEMDLKVQEAWHLYYDAQAELAEKLLNYEYNRK